MPSAACGGTCRLPKVVALAAAVCSFAWLGLSDDDDASKPRAGSLPVRRTPWTTSRVVGSPDPPPPFQVVRAFPSLKFDHPLLITRFPEGRRFVVGEQAGVLYTFPERPDARAEVFFDLAKEIKTVGLLEGAKGVEAVYGVAFHPDFARNRQCFVCYTLRGSDPAKPNLPDGTRVSRFKVTETEPPRIDASSEEIVFSFLQGGHNGGDLHFGPDGMLYISAGDAASPNPPDVLNTGQDISDPLSSILRIDVNRKDDGKNYAVPPDNPFVGMEGARPEVWAYGFRNPWRMSFDRQTGELFVGDVGWELWESVHRVEKGGNYGWSAMEGPQPIKPEKVGPTPIHPALIELPHSIACSITGGLVYHGQKFPELRGAYVFGDWETRRLWAARFEGDRTTEMPEIARPSVRFVAFCENQDGEIYFLDQEVGTVHTLERNDSGAQNVNFPTTLSQTGLFASTRDNTPAAGVLTFAVNSRQWQDGATAEHWAAFPGTSAATLYTTPKPIAGLVDWHYFRMHFPKDAVLVRTISLGGKRLETQILHYDGVDWRAYTFAWRDDQTDGDLVPAEGAEKEVAFGGTKGFWQFHGRGQCMSCHSNQSEYALAFLPEQLNRPGLDGRNQLVALTEAGFIHRAGDKGEPLPAFDNTLAARESKLAEPGDAAQPLEARARAYLHANCGHCHADHGGGSVPLRLQFAMRKDEMQAIGVRPTRGDLTLPDAYIIKPGDPYASTLYLRMAKFGRDRMPHMGSELPDEAGLDLIAEWISALPSGVAIEKGALPAEQPGDALSSPRAAQRLARKLARGDLNPEQRGGVLAAAAKLPVGPIRDLFEGYLPSTGPTERKLGSNPRPTAILTLGGDSSRGKELFWSKQAQCSTCHRIGNEGTAIGPDLSKIGAQRTREDLLASLLEPSRRIEPKFATYMAATTDGASHTGVLVARDAEKLILRDAQNKETTIAASDVEALRPSLTSLMPDGQLADLTAQEAADLLEYLATLK